ncbi:hypothetical protein [Nocardioides sp.]|uniref:hypothetical protein n=1 Tax=Nocardioides sp. TaxID=35761 RepID=UPI0025F4B49E|nr:hypothetical protein [Nocardioides sp.]
MNQPAPTRPRQVTLAGWLIMIGSLIVVAMVFDRVGALHTLETRESVEKFLAEPPGSDLGVGVDGIITLLRITSMVAAGCATAAAILGYQVLRRSRSARLALTVIAVPLFLTGMVTGGFVSSVVAAAALMLWLQPSRDWFQGRSTGPGTARAATPRAQAPVAPAASPYAVAQPPAVGGPTPAPAATDLPRPTSVMRASMLTWIFSGLTAVGLLITAAVIAVSPDTVLDDVHRRTPELEEQGISDDLLLAVTFVMIAAFVLWCVAASVLAALVLRGVDWARIVLIISAAIAAAVSLVALLAGAFLLVLLLTASVATILLLVRPDTAAWFHRTR